MHLSASLENVDFSGNFSEDKYEMHNDATIFVHRFYENNVQIISDKSIYINSEVLIDNIKNSYTLQQSELKIQDLTFYLNGNIIEHKDAVMLDIQSKGDNLKIEQLISLIPPEKQDKFEDYSSSGIINYSARINGMLSHTQSPEISIDFTAKNATLESPAGIEISKIELKGNFYNAANKSLLNSKITVDNVSGNTPKGSFAGNFILSGLENPYLSTNISASLDLEEIKDFFKLDTFSVLTGKVDANILYKGNVSELSKQENYSHLNASGKIALHKVQFSFNNEQTPYKIDTLFAKVSQTDLYIQQAYVNILNNKLYLQLTVNNILQYLLEENQTITINATVKATHLNLTQLLSKNTTQETTSKLYLNFPDKVKLKLSAQIDTLTFGKFMAQNLQTNISYANQSLYIHKANFVTCNGQFMINGDIIQNSEKQFLASGEATLNNVDIHCFFDQMDNFGQNEIVADNIYGIANLQTEFIIPFDTLLNINTKQLYALTNLEINKGRLVNYQTIMALSDYIEVDELKDIKFATLKTNVEIKNEKIIIPKTRIESSALNVTLSGIQGFDGSLDYHFSVMMNDILWRKAKNKNKNTEFGYVTDDGTGRAELFLYMRGNINQYKIGYDTKELKEKWKESLREEKHTIKQILKEEFGWFKKDTTLKNTQQTEPTDNGLQFDFGNDSDPKKEGNKTNQSQKNKTPKDKKDSKSGFWNKLTQPNEEEYEQDEDIE
jgi:hypothetical protein